MANVIDMQKMRYLNLFEKITRISTRFCFVYNETIVFCVPKSLVFKAIGENGGNIKKLNEILRKKIKVVPKPRGIVDLKSFIGSIVSPVNFKSLDLKGNEVVLTAGIQSKAALIGREKRRLLEMQKIIKDFFGREYKII